MSETTWKNLFGHMVIEDSRFSEENFPLNESDEPVRDAREALGVCCGHSAKLRCAIRGGFDGYDVAGLFAAGLYLKEHPTPEADRSWIATGQAGQHMPRFRYNKQTGNIHVGLVALDEAIEPGTKFLVFWPRPPMPYSRE